MATIKEMINNAVEEVILDEAAIRKKKRINHLIACKKYNDAHTVEKAAYAKIYYQANKEKLNKAKQAKRVAARSLINKGTNVRRKRPKQITMNDIFIRVKFLKEIKSVLKIRNKKLKNQSK